MWPPRTSSPKRVSHTADALGRISRKVPYGPVLLEVVLEVRPDYRSKPLISRHLGLEARVGIGV